MKNRTGYSSFTRFARFVLAANLLVIVWGGYVRASGSGAGCGAHWPLCNGVFVPQDPKIETLIELGHRVTSGLALIAVVVLGVWTLRRYPRSTPGRRGQRRLAWLAMIFIAGEAAIGAGIVLLKYVGENSSAARAVWMAGHLVNTFLLLAVLALLAERSRSSMPDENLSTQEGRADLPLPGRRGWLERLSLAALLLTAITGAIAALGDTLFPASSLAQGLAMDLSPTAHFLIRLRALHPLVAIATGLSWLYLAQQVRQASRSDRFPDSPPARRALTWAARVTGLVCLQFAIGLLTLVLLAPVALQLVHLAMADLVWIAGVLLVEARRSLPGQPASARATTSLKRRMPTSMTSGVQ